MHFRHGNRSQGSPAPAPGARSLTATAAALAAGLGTITGLGAITGGDRQGTDRHGDPDQLRDVLTAAPVGLALLDDRLRWRHLNAAFSAVTGLRRADLLGRP
ncbi:PAS domain-containing protein, partial [Streptomyces sp. FH025]|uniref:PAS domain-containing protein n=1 Tax=Streptomyces sp. FH025 TaxID=2815937 RepID=UPI001AC0CC59